MNPETVLLTKLDQDHYSNNDLETIAKSSDIVMEYCVGYIKKYKSCVIPTKI